MCTKSLISFTCMSIRTHVHLYWSVLICTKFPVNIYICTKFLVNIYICTKFLVNIYICIFHLYWSVLTCTVQFILTVVPTTGYGVVTFKILSVKDSIVLHPHQTNEKLNLGVGRIQFSLVFCIWMKTRCCCSTSPSGRLVGMKGVIEKGWNEL